MKSLPSQEFLETLIVRNETQRAPHKYVVIWFSANWCGPCKAIDAKLIESVRSDIVWYKCDVDEHEYTSTYCGVSAIPAFMAIINGKAQPIKAGLSQSKLVDWIKAL